MESKTDIIKRFANLHADEYKEEILKDHQRAWLLLMNSRQEPDGHYILRIPKTQSLGSEIPFVFHFPVEFAVLKRNSVGRLVPVATFGNQREYDLAARLNALETGELIMLTGSETNRVLFEKLSISLVNIKWFMDLLDNLCDAGEGVA